MYTVCTPVIKYASRSPGVLENSQEACDVGVVGVSRPSTPVSKNQATTVFFMVTGTAI